MRGEGYRLYLLSPVLDEMLQIIDASYVANGEVQMDYTRFRVLHQQVRDGLGQLGIQLPNLNEGGNATVFNREVRRIAHHARIGDIAGARRGAHTKHTFLAVDPAPPQNRPSSSPAPPSRQPQPASIYIPRQTRPARNESDFPFCWVALCLVVLLGVLGVILIYSVSNEPTTMSRSNLSAASIPRTTPAPRITPTALSPAETQRYVATQTARSRARPYATPKVSGNRAVPTRVLTVPSGYTQGYLDAAAICYAFGQLFLEGNYAYNLLFVWYEDEMMRSVNTQEAHNIIGALIELSDEMAKPATTSDSVWRIERRVLALCGLDDAQEGRQRY